MNNYVLMQDLWEMHDNEDGLYVIEDDGDKYFIRYKLDKQFVVRKQNVEIWYTMYLFDRQFKLDPEYHEIELEPVIVNLEIRVAELESKLGDLHTRLSDLEGV